MISLKRNKPIISIESDKRQAATLTEHFGVTLKSVDFGGEQITHGSAELSKIQVELT